MSEFAPKQGVLIECTDEGILEYILFLNSQRSNENKFIISDLPPRHLFIKPGFVDEIKKAINELASSNTFSEEQRAAKKKGRK